MPEICRFLGIVIYMLYDDHRPPHLHAEYGEYRITVEINSGVIQGRFPRRALKAVLEWCTLNRDRLLEARTSQEDRTTGVGQWYT